MESNQVCPSCASRGLTNTLKSFQMNFDDAIFMCPATDCPYPLDCDQAGLGGLLVQRNINQLNLPRKKLSRHNSRSTSCSSSRSSSPPLTLGNLFNKSEPKASTRSSNQRRLRSSEEFSKTLNSKLSSIDQHKQDSINGLKQLRSISNSPHKFPQYSHNNLSTVLPTRPAETSRQNGNSSAEQLFVESSTVPTNPPENGFELFSTPPCPSRVVSTEKRSSTSSLVSASPVGSDNVPDVTCNGRVKSNQNGSSIQRSRELLESDQAFIGNHVTANSANNKKLTHISPKKRDEQPRKAFFLQWKNKDALCWLDVSMSLLVHSRPFHNLINKTSAGSCAVMKDLLSVYSRAQCNVKKALELKRYQLLGQQHRILHLETSLGLVTVKTGGGDATTNSPFVCSANISPIKSMRDSQSVDKNGNIVITTEELDKVSSQISNSSRVMIDEVRDRVWAYLYPKLKCDRGVNDSPVFSLPFLIGEDPLVKASFTHKFTWRMTCQHCQLKHEDSVVKTVTTFPAVPKDFSLRKPYFTRSCFRCNAPHQRMWMDTKGYPDLFIVHFVDGLHRSISSYDFFHGGEQFMVSGVVQYKHNPDHFVSWIRSPQSKWWMECDDLKHSLCSYVEEPPQIKSSQVHLVMWTRKSLNQPALPLYSTPPKETNAKIAGVNLQCSPLKSALKTAAIEQNNVNAPSKMSQVKKKLTADFNSVVNSGREFSAPYCSDTGNVGQNGVGRVTTLPSTDMHDKLSLTSNDHSFVAAAQPVKRKTKVSKMKPAELAKMLLSKPLLPGVSRNDKGRVGNNNLSFNSKTLGKPHGGQSSSTTASFQGYVLKGIKNVMEKELVSNKLIGLSPVWPVLKSSKKGVSNKDNLNANKLGVNKKSLVRKSVNFAEETIKPKLHGVKRKSNSNMINIAKHAKIADVEDDIAGALCEDGQQSSPKDLQNNPLNMDFINNLTSNHDEPSRGAVMGSPGQQPVMEDVLDELCAKLNIPQVGTCEDSALTDFSIDELFGDGVDIDNQPSVPENGRANGSLLNNHAVMDFDIDMYC